MTERTANIIENVSLIPLTQNEFAIVDPEDVEMLDEYRWGLTAKNQLRYARRKENGKTIYMHREIMNAPAGMQIDHINGNGLDNRRVNLRVCTVKQNQQNASKRAISSSRFKGVAWIRKKWIARITLNYRTMHIGSYHDEVRAAQAYDEKAAELFGEFANLNFPSQKAKLISEKKQNTSQAACPPPATSGGKHKYVDLWHCGL